MPVERVSAHPQCLNNQWQLLRANFLDTLRWPRTRALAAGKAERLHAFLDLHRAALGETRAGTVELARMEQQAATLHQAVAGASKAARCDALRAVVRESVEELGTLETMQAAQLGHATLSRMHAAVACLEDYAVGEEKDAVRVFIEDALAGLPPVFRVEVPREFERGHTPAYLKTAAGVHSTTPSEWRATVAEQEAVEQDEEDEDEDEDEARAAAPGDNANAAEFDAEVQRVTKQQPAAAAPAAVPAEPVNGKPRSPAAEEAIKMRAKFTRRDTFSANAPGAPIDHQSISPVQAKMKGRLSHLQ